MFCSRLFFSSNNYNSQYSNNYMIYQYNNNLRQNHKQCGSKIETNSFVHVCWFFFLGFDFENTVQGHNFRFLFFFNGNVIIFHSCPSIFFFTVFQTNTYAYLPGLKNCQTLVWYLRKIKLLGGKKIIFFQVFCYFYLSSYEDEENGYCPK